MAIQSIKKLEDYSPSPAGANSQIQYNNNGVLGASSNFVIDGAGNVGIGETTPNYPLDVKGGAAYTGTIEGVIKGIETGAGQKGLLLGYDTSSQTAVLLSHTAAAASNMAFYTYSGSVWGERMRIDSIGNVGIGTTTPNSLFNVVSDISTSVYFEQYTNDANGPSLTLDKGRGVETSPAAILADDKLGLIQFAGWSAGGQRLGCAAIQSFASQNWSLNSGGAYITFSTSPDGGTAYQERMRIDSAGIVGIGNTSPGSYRAISRSTLIVGSDAVLDNSGISIITNSGYTGRLNFGDGTGDPAQHMGIVAYAHNDNKMYFYTANFARMAIDGSGSVSIINLTASSDVQTDGSKNLISVSDSRLKDDFGTMADGSLSIINQITPHYFKYKSDVANGVDALQLGFYAQEIHPLIPEAAPCSPAMVPSLDADGKQILDEDGHAVMEDSGDVIWGFNGRPIQAHLVKAIQELTAQVETLQAQVTALQGA